MTSARAARYGAILIVGLSLIIIALGAVGLASTAQTAAPGEDDLGTGLRRLLSQAAIVVGSVLILVAYLAVRRVRGMRLLAALLAGCCAAFLTSGIAAPDSSAMEKVIFGVPVSPFSPRRHSCSGRYYPSVSIRKHTSLGQPKWRPSRTAGSQPCGLPSRW
jgi:xanthine/uracil/vitamin C permease (AzgA family)